MNFYTQVEEIAQKDPRYKPDAYEFVIKALWFTQKKLKRKGHVTGEELLSGIREFGLDRYGGMAKNVFHHWGVKATDDFGEIVFNMIDNRLLGKTDTDQRKDFKNVYDFDAAFDIKNLDIHISEE